MSTKFKSVALRALSAATALAIVLTGFAPGTAIAAGSMSEEELREAIANADARSTVVLTGDVELTKELKISKPLTLDLDGHMISRTLEADPNGQIMPAVWLSASLGNVTVKGGTIESNANTVYIGADNCTLENCTVITTSDELSGVMVSGTFNSGTTTTVKSCRLTAPTEGIALSKAFQDKCNLILTGNNEVKGGIEFTCNGSETDQTYVIDGGAFDAGGRPAFANKNNAGDAALAKCLSIKSGFFKVKPIDTFIDASSQCVETPDAEFPYKVAPSGETGEAYIEQADGSRLFFDTLGQALESAKGNVVHLAAAVTLDDLSALRSARITGVVGTGIACPDATLAEVVSTGVSLEGVALTCSDAAVAFAQSAGGKLFGGSLERDTYQAAQGVLQEGVLVAHDSYAIRPQSEFEARIGIVGCSSITNAVSLAGGHDGAADSPVNEEVVLLKDITTKGNAIEVVSPEATFTLNLNGKKVESEAAAALIIAYKTTSGGSIVQIPHNANITVKNGILAGSTFGVVVNGMVENVTLRLENVTVTSQETAVYLPASGSTTIIGGSYTGKSGIQLCGGSLTIDGAKVVATGRPQDKKPGDDGPFQDGASVSVISRDGYPALGSVEIKGGTFVAADGVSPLQTYHAASDNKPAEWPDAGESVDVSGGSFSAPIDDSLFADGFGGSMRPNSNGQYVVVSEQQYTVKHLFEELGTGKFVEDEKLAPEEILIGDIDEDSQAKPKDVAGFTAKSIEQKPVASDGTTVVEIYYLRNSYEITFESNGGTTVEKQTVKYGEKVVKPADPVREGYTFDAWYSDKALTKAFDFTTALDPKTNEPAITLYAKWSVVEKPGPKPEKPIIHKVTFIPIVGGDEKIVVEVKDGDFVTLPNTPTHPGYTFAGWFKDKALKEPFEADKTAITGDLTLYGGWHKNDSDDTTVTPELPKTGDDSMLPIAIAGVAGVAAVVAGIVIVVKRRNAK